MDLIKVTFDKLVGQFHADDQNETKKKLFLPYFIQFLLDSYIITQHFMSLFLLPLCKDRWIDVDKYIAAMESIQQMSFERASFFYQERDPKFKKNVAIQKMLCKGYLVFFRLVEFYCASELDETDLAFVLSMSLRNNKKRDDVKGLARATFDKLEKMNHGVKKGSISFKEFYKILVNT